jgi:hypothetical protein
MMSNAAPIKALLNDTPRLTALAKGAFDAVDRDKSGFIEEVELFAVMTKVSKAVETGVPTKQQVKTIVTEVDLDRDGQISFAEYLALVRKTLYKIINENDPALQSADAARLERIKAAEKRIQEAEQKRLQEAEQRRQHEAEQNRRKTEELRRIQEAEQKRLHDAEQRRLYEAENERLRKQAADFERYIADSGLPTAFQNIFTEIIAKKVESAKVFLYTAMRLRQIGEEAAKLRL